MLSRTCCSFVLAAASLCAADAMPEVRLWANGAPGSEGKTGKEVLEPENASANFVRVSNIHQPSITVYLPDKAAATGAAMIVAPGGGHRLLAIEHEGYNVARYLNSVGVAAFVLKYRLAREANSTYKVEVHALADAQRAVQMVRSRAEEWRVNPQRVGIMGFSAGGELAAMAATRVLPAKPDAADAVEHFPSRPDFVALIYPGKGAQSMSVNKDTPPTFLLCADNDRGPAQAIWSLYGELKQAGVPAELHIYGSGGHGFGLRPGTHPAPVMDTWVARLSDWMRDRGVLKP